MSKSLSLQIPQYKWQRSRLSRFFPFLKTFPEQSGWRTHFLEVTQVLCWTKGQIWCASGSPRLRTREPTNASVETPASPPPPSLWVVPAPRCNQLSGWGGARAHLLDGDFRDSAGGDRKWRFSCFRLGHCFRFCWPLPCLALGGRRRGAPVRGPGTGREVLPGPGPLGWGCSAGTAAAHFPGWRRRPDPLLPRGRQHGPDDAQKAPDVEQPLCPSAPTSCAWHRARHLRAQRWAGQTWPGERRSISLVERACS